MADIRIRNARDAELDDVADLIARSYAQYGPSADASADLVKAFEEYQREQRDVRGRMKDSELLVAEMDGRLVGSVTFYPPKPGGTGENWGPNWAAIRLLGVDPDARGAGIGRALTEECLLRARELGAVEMGLHTTRLMDVARAMYERMGFVRFPENDIPITDDFVVVAYRLPLLRNARRLSSAALASGPLAVKVVCARAMRRIPRRQNSSASPVITSVASSGPSIHVSAPYRSSARNVPGGWPTFANDSA